MESSNPTFRARAFDSISRVFVGSEAMTVRGTLTKTLVLMLATAFSAGVVWTAEPTVYGPAMLTGAIGGLILALATSFRPDWAKYTAPLYAVFEGLALGAISAIYNARYAGLPATAVAITLVTAIALLTAYRMGWVRVTDRMRTIASVALVSLLLTYLVTWVLSLFGVPMTFMTGSGTFGIGFSILTTGLAAFFLLLDIDNVEAMAAAGLPKSMEWYGAFGLLVTLIWLYLELLRLLSKLQKR